MLWKHLEQQSNKQVVSSHIFGINIGSSRGATDLFEKHQARISRNKGQTLASAYNDAWEYIFLGCTRFTEFGS
jgi:hypothetical protein